MRWRLAFILLLGCGTQAGPTQSVDAAFDAPADAIEEIKDCVFPSGRVCLNGQNCISDDICNGCSCDNGKLACSAMNCTFLDGGACEQGDGGWVPSGCGHDNTVDFACARDMPATPYAFDCDILNDPDAGCPQNGCRQYYIDTWCCPAP